MILSRAISCIENNPAQLRNAVYELARIKLRKEVCRTQPISLRRLTLALESAIESVETIYSRHEELRALRSLHQLVEISEIGWSEVMAKPRGPLLIIDQPAAQTAEANHRPKGAPSLLQIVQILPTDVRAMLQEGACARRIGKPAEADALFHRAESLRPKGWIPTYNRACLLATTGKPDEALQVLTGLASRHPLSLELIETDKDLQSVRALPAYNQFRKQLTDALEDEDEEDAG